MRGEVHLFLAAYYVVPIGAYLALSVLDGRARIGLATAGLAALVALASGSFYYSAFTVLLVAVAAVLRFFAARDRRAFLPAAFVVGVILAVSLVQLAPTIVYRAKHGTNEEVAKRYWFESENYSLRLTQLLLPVDGHRIDALASRKAEYTEQIPQNEGRAATLGIVGVRRVPLAARGRAAGRRGRLAGGDRAVSRPRGADAGRGPGRDDRRALDAARRRVAADPRLEPAVDLHRVLRAPGGGAPARVASAAASCARLRGAARRAARARRARPDVAVLHPAACRRSRPTTEPTSRGIARWKGSYRRARRSCSCRTSPSPSRRSGRRPLYEPAKGYLHTSDLRWSWGAMRGRPDDWSAPVCDAARRGARPGGARGGLRGDRGRQARVPGRRRRDRGRPPRVLGAEPERSPEGRYLLWRL